MVLLKFRTIFLGSFDTPVHGSVVSGNIPVTGWALDDIGIVSVKIKRDPVAGDPGGVIGPDGLVYIGEAVFIRGARPDVEAVYPGYPNADRAGWGYMMLTNFLPGQGNGVIRLHAIVEDTSGQIVDLGVRVITCENAYRVKPFGTIDTPRHGGLISGDAFVNFGWALTPSPKKIPRYGSTINVIIDGKNVGHPTFDQYREDIATLFPGYINSDGAVGYFIFDTTQYENGVLRSLGAQRITKVMLMGLAPVFLRYTTGL